MKITKNKLITLYVFLLLIFLITSNNQLESWIKYRLISLAEKNLNSVNDQFAINNWFVDVNANFPDKSKIDKREESLFFEIPTKNSFYLTYSESKLNIFDRKNPAIRKLILQIDSHLILYNPQISSSMLTEANAKISEKDCFELLFNQKNQIENLYAIRVCPSEAENSSLVLNRIKNSISNSFEKIYHAPTIKLSSFHKFRFKSLTNNKNSNKQISILPPMLTNSISIGAPGLPMASSVLSPVPCAAQAVMPIGPFATPVAQVLDMSNLTKNIDCVLKECFVYYAKNSSSNKIIAPFSSKIHQVAADQYVPVKLTLNTNHLVVRLSDNAEILRFQLIEIEAVQKSQMNSRCYNVFDVIGNKFKFCQMENLINCSADNWISDIAKFKNQCADSFALTDASFETIVIPSSMTLGINGENKIADFNNGKKCKNKADKDKKNEHNSKKKNKDHKKFKTQDDKSDTKKNESKSDTKKNEVKAIPKKTKVKAIPKKTKVKAIPKKTKVKAIRKKTKVKAKVKAKMMMTLKKKKLRKLLK